MMAQRKFELWPSAGDWVTVPAGVMGFAQGPSDQHANGAPREIPAGSKCEVFDVDKTTGFITVHWELETSGAHEPFRVSALVERHEIAPAGRPSLPPIEMPDPPADLNG